MDRLKDKVAIVTGSTSGIGTGIAKMFGAEGARVVVCGRNEERGAAVVDAIAEAGGTAWFHKLDITSLKRWTPCSPTLRSTGAPSTCW